MGTPSNTEKPRAEERTDVAAFKPGPRTRTQLDDALTRTVGRLSPMAGAAVALGVYIALGIALPVALSAGRSETLALGSLGAFWGVVVLLAAVFAAQQAGHRRLLIEWTSDLRKLDATEFEWLVGELLHREGWTVTETGRRDAPDGNIDLRAERNGRLLVVQCKRWTSRLVGVDEVRKIAGTATGESCPQTSAVLVTLAGFSQAAIDEGDRLRVQLVDGKALLERIERVRKSEACPNCGTAMILDRSSRGWWLRCPRFPSCAGKRDLAQAPGAAVDLLLGSV